MSFKEDIKAICDDAIENNTDVLVRLPRAPLSWTKDMVDERFFQLFHLIKSNGCIIEKVNLTDYKIRKLNDQD